MPLRSAHVLALTFGGLVLGLVVYLARLIGGLDLGTSTLSNDALYTGIEVVAVVLVAWRALAGPGQRKAWTALAIYAALWSAGDLGWTLHFDAEAHPPFPNWTDALYVASYGFAYVGIGLLLRARSGAIRASLWLDGLIAGLALGALCAALFLEPVLDSAAGSSSAVAITLAYPVLDVVLLCLVGVAFGVGSWKPGPLWAALGLALATSAVGDAAYSWQEANGTYTVSAWLNATWPTALALLAGAAWAPAGRRLQARDGDGDGVFAVPALFAALSLGVLVASSSRDVGGLAVIAAAAALATAGLRGWLTHRENVALLRRSRHEALEDGLTGLPNRRRLMLDLRQALGSGHDDPSTLVFFDLDGFKGYNDNFGHGAGDALLARLGLALAQSVARAGTAYRLGGDEFCVLFACDATRDAPAVLRAARALSESGEGFSISTSYGLVSLPKEAPTPSAALQLADERMYGHKGTRRGSPGSQGRDLLIQVLRERAPDLEEHVDDVGVLALAVGRELGLDVEALDEIARAAELHDVGKIAVPEAILNKPGPLDDAEWEVMRQHTIVGERILAAAPSLRPVGRLVRSSHERWDGSGYPDGLAGERIPLGARIIAVCDAFDAMRQIRAYAGSMTEGDALAELHRCAGTQFDPQVVAAFAGVMEAGAGRTLRVA
ncbi:MAG: diguanylate cyclase and metal dependent phosphohydrolase [Conexibacter sp.]|nr:diguanylate cyclase and metal dependent phosphohydrolase [Conexibacter sp.]